MLRATSLMLANRLRSGPRYTEQSDTQAARELSCLLRSKGPMLCDGPGFGLVDFAYPTGPTRVVNETHLSRVHRQRREVRNGWGENRAYGPRLRACGFPGSGTAESVAAGHLAAGRSHRCTHARYRAGDGCRGCTRCCCRKRPCRADNAHRHEDHACSRRRPGIHQVDHTGFGTESDNDEAGSDAGSRGHRASRRCDRQRNPDTHAASVGQFDR
jgi:hypothetical protein